jgi:hypothetical protein
LGGQGGELLPGAFRSLPADYADQAAVQMSPYFSLAGGIAVVVVFLALLAVLVIRAEPGLFIFCAEVELLTSGRLTARSLKLFTSLGCAVGLLAGCTVMIATSVELQMAYLLVGVNCLRLLLTAISQPVAISVSWDSAGIATGPIAVPFVLSLGLGLAKSLGGSSTGFGLVALMAGGIVVVMLLVMMLLMRSSRQRQQSA